MYISIYMHNVFTYLFLRERQGVAPAGGHGAGGLVQRRGRRGQPGVLEDYVIVMFISIIMNILS